MSEEERAWSYLLRLLSFRPRTKKELRSRLSQRGFSQDTVEKVLAWAEEEGFVDDKNFALLYAEDRLLSRPCPRRMVAFELRAKGVEPGLAMAAVKKVLPELTDEELARQALAEKKGRWQSLSLPVAMRRAYNFLLRRGFSPSLAKKIVEEAFGPWTSASE